MKMEVLGGKLRIRLRKVKDLVNKASILAIFYQRSWKFFGNFHLNYAIFLYFLFSMLFNCIFS